MSPAPDIDGVLVQWGDGGTRQRADAIRKRIESSVVKDRLHRICVPFVRGSTAESEGLVEFGFAVRGSKALCINPTELTVGVRGLGHQVVTFGDLVVALHSYSILIHPTGFGGAVYVSCRSSMPSTSGC
jgi:hypothetical protein